MPGKTTLEIPADEQAALLKELRAARYGYLLALRILLLCEAGRTPSEIAAFLYCSRSSVYRVVAAYKSGARGLAADAGAASELPRRMPSLKQSLLALIKRVPSSFGWCRVRWSCAALAIELHTRRGLRVSRETVRR